MAFWGHFWGDRYWGNAYWGSPVTRVDAGPDRVLCNPCVDLSLFGQARDSLDVTKSCTWSKVSGPGTVTFSRADREISTATFSAPGVYVLRLTAGAISDTTTVTVVDEATLTRFYVDPTYTGGSNDGSAAHPWTSISYPVTVTDAPWIAINSALASNHVVIYCSARQAGSDTAEVEHNQLTVWRTDTSTHQLIFDGMSRYNTNDSSGSWAAYSGAHKFNLAIIGYDHSIGVTSDDIAYPLNYVTIRGFDCSGDSGRLTGVGDYYTVEYCDSHDVTVTGPNIMIHAAVQPYPTCTAEFGNKQFITVRNNTVDKSLGESIYVAGNYQRTSDGGCPSWGNSHNGILIESNTITNPGFNGGQGDGIDLKAGLTNVAVRGNHISNVTTGHGAWGIVSIGIFNAATLRSHVVVENNTLIDANGINGTDLSDFTVRNNVIKNGGIYIAGAVQTDLNNNLAFVNNTIHGKREGHCGIAVQDAHGVYVRNNLISGLTGSDQQLGTSGTVTDLDSDYNTLVTGAAVNSWTEGGHSQYFTTGTVFYTDLTGNDLTLRAASPAIDLGEDLSTGTFTDALDGTIRPIGASWDAGAFEAASAAELVTSKVLTTVALGSSRLSVTKVETTLSLGTSRLAATKTLVVAVIDGTPESWSKFPKLLASAVISLPSPIEVSKLLTTAVLGAGALSITKVISGAVGIGIDPEGVSKLVGVTSLGTARLSVTKTAITAVLGASRDGLTKLLLTAVLADTADVCPDGGLGDEFTPHYRLEKCKNVFITPVGFDLTDYAILFTIRKPSGAYIQRDGVIVDATGGVIKWITGHTGDDLDETGEYVQQAKLINSGRIRYSVLDSFYVQEVY